MMFYDDLPDLPIPEIKRLVITRRINMLIDWLEKRYSTYESHTESTKQFTDFIELVIDALGSGIPAEDWKPYHQTMVEVRKFVRMIANIEDDKEQELAVYNESVLMLKTILEQYSVRIQGYDFSYLN